jgi:hypothetical protein
LVYCQAMNEPFSPQQKEFLIQEYSALRDEIELTLKELRSIERYAIIATGGVWAWLAGHALQVWTWAIPLIFVVCGFLRHRVLINHLIDMGTYIRCTTEPFFLGPGAGWENHYHKSNDWRLDTVSNNSVWIFLAAASLLAPLVAHFFK